LHKGICYLPEAIEQYKQKQEYLQDFMESMRNNL
ncbi:MAG: hypothetical protein K0Q53_2200, partial [Massilibacillus sp.]|nr:hypothetical protein [Massilibacillus sp.]